tara:strand:+ start:264 stop:482 length:219 start_codon:yes stop_codon:yes gene_type:complete
VAYPPGYKELFEYSLAERLADEFGVAVPPGVMKRAFSSRMMIKRQNKKQVQSTLSVPGIENSTRRYSIYSDS